LWPEGMEVHRRECDWVLGACMLVRRNALEEAGLFDPDIFMYAEEMELCYRIKAHGWKVIFEPDAKIIHFGGASWNEKKYSQAFLIMVGLLFFFKKHSSKLVCLIVMMFYAIGSLLRLGIWGFHYLLTKKRDNILLEIRTNLKILKYLANKSRPFSEQK